MKTGYCSTGLVNALCFAASTYSSIRFQISMGFIGPRRIACGSVESPSSERSSELRGIMPSVAIDRKSG
jgi:hypothetical protein